MNEFLIELHELLARHKASISPDMDDEYNLMANPPRAVITVGDEEFSILRVLDAYDLKRYLGTIQK